MDYLFILNVVLNTDEQALVNAARSLGIVFQSRTPDSITIDVVGTVGVAWDVVWVLESEIGVNSKGLHPHLPILTLHPHLPHPHPLHAHLPIITFPILTLSILTLTLPF